jgi:hypothetical protein
VREQQKLIDKHRQAITVRTAELNHANEHRSKLIALRDAAQQEKRQLSRFTERREIDRLNLLLTKREAEAEHATKQAGEIQGRINYMNLVDLKPLMEKPNELMAEEARLNHYVTGQSYTTDLGIVVPARPPI